MVLATHSAGQDKGRFGTTAPSLCFAKETSVMHRWICVGEPRAFQETTQRHPLASTPTTLLFRNASAWRDAGRFLTAVAPSLRQATSALKPMRACKRRKKQAVTFDFYVLF